MNKVGITHIHAECIGCKACEVQCRSIHGDQIVSPFCQIREALHKKQRPHAVEFTYLACFHCKKPKCVPACPTGAMRARADGLVYLEADLCDGCKACIAACPWHIPVWNPRTGKVEKCDLCTDRIDQGLEPACVATCAMSCLHFSGVDAAQPH